MINHLYIDNYRCFTNFEWKPGVLSLLLGDNGSGKSSIFDVVEALREFIVKHTETDAAFPSSTLTAWDKRREQTFELGIAGNGGQYVYRLVIDHNADIQRNRIKLERLVYDNIILYQFEEDEAHLYRDNGSTGPVFPVDWSRSALGTIPARHDNQRLTWFRKRLEHVYVLSSAPQLMRPGSDREATNPGRHFEDYVSWLRHLSNDLTFPARLVESLDPVMDGLEGMKFEPTGESSKELRFLFDFDENGSPREKKSFSVPFDRLSDGQRCLAALYTGLLLAENEECSFLWDEPDNYVSLREIQPWFSAVRDLAEERGRQHILISHHPELINASAAENGILIYRDTGGPARVKPFEWQADGVSPAEIVARGWEE